MTNNTESLESKLGIDSINVDFAIQTIQSFSFKDISNLPKFIETILTNIEIPKKANHISIKGHGKDYREFYPSTIDTDMGSYDITFYDRIRSKNPAYTWEKNDFLTAYENLRLEKDKITIEHPKREYSLK